MHLKRLKLKKFAFEAGFFSIFGLVRSPFYDAAKAIQKRTFAEGLYHDYEAIAQDFNRVFQKEAEKIDGKTR